MARLASAPILGAIICFLSLAGSLVAGPRYVVTEIGLDPALLNLTAVAVNNSCQVALNGVIPLAQRVYLWQDGVAFELPGLPGVPGIPGLRTARAFGINDLGQVVGESMRHACIWTGGVPFDLCGAGATGRALAVNRLGHALGSQSGTPGSVLWKDGQVIALGSLDHSPLTGSAVNDRDQVVGSFDYPTPSGSISAAFLWENGTAVRLMPPPGHSAAGANDLNNQADVVGWTEDSLTLERHAALWQNGVPSLLPAGAAGESTATKINNAGTVIGSRSSGPCIWQDGQVYDVQLAEPDDQQWRVSSLIDINDNGVILASARAFTSLNVPLLLHPVDEVQIDVRPFVEPNVINMKSNGKVPVLVVATPDFDPSTIVLDTVRFAEAPPLSSRLVDLDGDGDLDLLLQFNVQDLQLVAEDFQASLTGWTTAHHAIRGADEVVVRGVRPGPVPRKLRYACRVLASLSPDRVRVEDTNEAGQVVGYLGGGVYSLGFVWNPDGSEARIPRQAGALGCWPKGIDDSGVVVGQSPLNYWGSGIGWVYSEEQGLLAIPPMQGYRYSGAAAINNAGTIVGECGNEPESPERIAFRRSPDGAMTSLEPLPGATKSEAHDVNEAGVAVGRSWPWNGEPRACLWDPQGGVVDLGAVAGVSSSASGVNDLGAVTGQSAGQAFLWTAEGGMRGIGSLGGSSFGCDINNAGLVVGASRALAGETRAFAWTEETGMVQLPSPGWAEARAVNEHGVIAGHSHTEVLVWEPIPPTPVVIDIRPNLYPNLINLTSRGLIPVAVITTPDFDADIVNGPTATFADARPTSWEMLDVDRDGDNDLLLHFEVQDLDLTPADTQATLTAVTKDDREVVGTDSVVVVQRR